MSRTVNTLRQAEFIALDLETTGLFPVGAQIVEIGAVRFRSDGTVLDQFQQLVDPRCAIPQNVVKIHGISDSMVVGQPPIEQVLPRFARFLGDAPAVLMAHNAGFDLGFLAVAFSRAGQSSPSHPVIDTCDLARRRLALPNYKLQTIGRHLCLIHTERHRALDDAMLLKDVFMHLIQRPPAIDTVDKLYRLSPALSFEWFATVLDDPPAGFEELWEALVEQQRLEMRYMGGSTPGAVRVVTPRAVIQTGGRIYLSAFCHQSGCDKTFRLDRIASYRKAE